MSKRRIISLHPRRWLRKGRAASSRRRVSIAMLAAAGAAAAGLGLCGGQQPGLGAKGRPMPSGKRAGERLEGDAQ